MEQKSDIEMLKQQIEDQKKKKKKKKNSLQNI